MIRNKKHFYIWGTLSLLFMIIIFWQSGKPYQEQDIKPFLSDWVELSPEQLPKIEFTYDEDFVTYREPYSFIEFFVRKAGHVSEFGLLTFFLIMTLRQTEWNGGLAVLIGGVISFIYALSDEWHQSMVPNRTGHLIDVYTFDLLGIVLVMGLVVVLMKIRRWD